MLGSGVSIQIPVGNLPTQGTYEKPLIVLQLVTWNSSPDNKDAHCLRGLTAPRTRTQPLGGFSTRGFLVYFIGKSLLTASSKV